MNVQITIQSDSVTALATTQKKSGASAAQNFCGAVLGVLLERYRVEDAKLQHIPGVANKVADYLSRPSMWGKSTIPRLAKEPSRRVLSGTMTSIPYRRQAADRTFGASRKIQTRRDPGCLGLVEK